MSDHIKSADLCNRCYYGSGNSGCNQWKCKNCKMADENTDCKCLGVKNNTPCKYFKEDGNDGM